MEHNFLSMCAMSIPCKGVRGEKEFQFTLHSSGKLVNMKGMLVGEMVSS